MPRRSHKKSRNGCLECKNRHIKCDESKPECVNCLTAGSHCSFKTPSYLTPPAIVAPGSRPSSSQSGIPSPRSENVVTASPKPTSISDPNLNLEHLELLHHFVTVTFATFHSDALAQDVWRNVIPRQGLSFPFVMYEILAIGALHRGYLDQVQRDHYYQRATELQNHAMTGFRAIQMNVDESNCAAVLVFSALLALQVLADRSRASGLSSYGYIEHFLRCVKLMHGTRLLVIEEWWPHVANLEELHPLTKVEPPDTSPCKLPREVAQLMNLASSTSLSDTARAAYDQAIDRLHWLYALAENPDNTYSTAERVVSWPVQLENSYLDLLNERRPEALIILAYYGTLLHFYRKCWVVGDTGTCLVKAIQ